MIEDCLAAGVVPVPAAFSPQEMLACAAAGADTIKVFPAQLWTPATLKDLRAIGSFGALKLCPSGGVTPDNARAWFDHGAHAVGMGSNLVGGDVRAAPGSEAFRAARAAWEADGRARARDVFARFSSSA